MTNFRQYLNEAQGKTLRNLVNNFKKVHPYSNINLEISSVDIKNPGLNLVCQAICKSESENKVYQVYIQLHKNKLEDKFTIDDKCEIKCTCKAFRYYDAYPNVLNKSFYNKPTNWNKVRNKVRNKELVPTLCKHLYAFVKYLIANHIIEMK
jgi:hypothetical protein